MSQDRSAPDNLVRIGALRSRLVSKLTGLSMRQLQRWHETGLLEAHHRRGARGHPRLYSWVDYMKLREAAKLRCAGVPTTEIRRGVELLDQISDQWYLLSLRGEAGKLVVARLADQYEIAANRRGQVCLPWPAVLSTLTDLQREGPLGELRRFEDAVDMHPAVLAGNPVVRDSRPETRFIAELGDMGHTAEEIAHIYHLPAKHVERAIACSKAIAA